MTTDPANGMWLLPSRRRPKNLKRFCNALHETKTSTKGLVLIQASEFQDESLNFQYGNILWPEGWQVVRTQGESQGDKIREVQSRYWGGDWVGLIGDDQVVKTEHWDLKIIEWLKGWNLVTCRDDGWQVNERGPNGILQETGRFCGAPCWSGELVRTVGYIFPNGMHHLYLDDCWEEMGIHTGCWNFKEHSRPDVVIDHIHFQRGQVDRDETYHMAYSVYGAMDRPLWDQWRSHGIWHDIELIKKLKEQIEAAT